MSAERYAVIIAGGSGERLWPLSSSERPKQFLDVFGGTSLIRQAMERVLPLVPSANILVVTAKALAKATYADLPELDRANVLLEPCRKNTAPAIAAALGEVRRRAGEDACVAILTADQLMTKPAVFRRLLKRAYAIAARRDVVVTLGVTPRFAATGFGYIHTGTKVFVEKPDAATAARYLKSGNYVWNAGMFIFRTGALQAICRKVAPELADLSERVRTAKSVRTLLPRIYPTLTSISFDYAVMEKIRDIEVVSGDFGWDDVGGYPALAAHLPRDGAGNVVRGNVRLLDCGNSILIGEGVRVSAFGLKDVVVATRGAEVLVMSRERAADLKKILSV